MGARWAFAACRKGVYGMIDFEEAPDVSDSGAVCEACSASLRATRYVHAETWVTYVLCSVRCYRGIVRERRRVRWAARSRFVQGVAVAAILAGGFFTPHEGPPGR